MRPAGLHSPSAEEKYMTENVASLRSVKVVTPPLAPLKRLSLIGLPAANGLSKPFADGKSTGDSRFSGARGCSHLDGTK